MHEIFEALKQGALDLAVAIIPVVLGYAVRYLIALIEREKEATRYQTEKRLLTITEKVVTGIYQNLVEDLKKEGKFNKQLADAMKRNAIKQIKEELKANGKGLLKALEKDLDIDNYIGRMIESVIYHKKRNFKIGEIETPVTGKKIKGIEFNWKF